MVLIAVKDGAAAKAWVSKQLGGSQTTETYAGGEITIVSGPLKSNLAFAVRGTVLILGPEKTVKAALDTAGASAFASSESFTAARKTAPSAYLGYGYVDLKAFTDAALAAAGDQATLPAACLDTMVAKIPAWAAGSARAEDDALVFTATAPTAGATSTAKDSASAIASHLPASTVAAYRSARPGGRPRGRPRLSQDRPSPATRRPRRPSTRWSRRWRPSAAPRRSSGGPTTPPSP